MAEKPPEWRWAKIAPALRSVVLPDPRSLDSMVTGKRYGQITAAASFILIVA